MESRHNSQIGGITRAWGPILGAFIAIAVLFHTSDSVGNFFDVERYFVFEIFIPALITLAALAIIRHFYDRNWIRFLLVAVTAAASFWFAGLGLTFASQNPEGPIWVHGYLIVYNPIPYAIILAGILSLLYFGTLDLIDQFRTQQLPREPAGLILSVLCKKMLQAFVFAALLLLCAQYVAVGLFYLLLPVGITLSFLLPTTRLPDKIEGAPSPEQTPSMNRRRAVVLSLAVAISFLLIGFLWAVQYLRLEMSPGPEPELTWVYYLLNPRLVLEDGLLTISIAILLLLGLLLIPRIFGKRLENWGKDSTRVKLQAESWLLLIFCISLAIGFIWYSSGITILGLRPANFLYPVWIICGIAWIVTLAVRQGPSPTGMLSGFFILGSITFWLGFVLGFGAEEDYGWLYITTILFFAIFLLVVGTFLPEVRRKRQTTPDTTSPAASVKRHQLLKFSPRHASVPPMVISRPVQALVIIGLIATPAVLFTLGSVQSSANFRVLANVDDNCIFYLADTFNKVDQNYRPGFGAAVRYDVNNTIQVSAARNEFESVQIVMLPINQKHFSLYDIAFSGFRHESTSDVINASAAKFQAYTVEYVSALANKVPDILVPFAPLGVSDGLNHPLWFTFYVPLGALEGDYSSNITLTVDKKYGSGVTPQDVTLSLRLHVFNFTLPRQPTLQSNFGLSSPPLSARFNATMQVFQDHRMGYWAHAPMPPFNITATGVVDFVNFTAMDEYYAIFHAWETHSFGVGFYPESSILQSTFDVDGTPYSPSNFSTCPKYNTTLAQYLFRVEDHLKNQSFLDDLGRNITWYSETYFVGRDEVDAAGGAQLEWAIGNYTWLKETLNMTLPIMQTMGDSAELRAVVDIICHHTGGREPDYLHEWQASGKEAWIYTTCGPRFPGPSIQTGTFNLQVRALGWQTFLFNYTHYLIWDVQTPYNEGDGYGYQGWNGGTLLYRAPNDGRYLSARLENVRDGFEDHDYFVLLNASIDALKIIDPTDPHVGEGTVLQRRITALMNDYIPSMDYRAFEQLRIDIGSLLGDISILK